MDWVDDRLTSVDVAFLISEEDGNQVDKWGIQVRTPFEWMAYLTEEVGELAKAVSEYVYRDGDRLDVEKEGIQVATLAMKIVSMCRQDAKAKGKK
jgi:NTP pyrophosphatase (non-canonical NTP hydrolase)